MGTQYVILPRDKEYSDIHQKPINTAVVLQQILLYREMNLHKILTLISKILKKTTIRRTCIETMNVT